MQTGVHKINNMHKMIIKLYLSTRNKVIYTYVVANRCYLLSSASQYDITMTLKILKIVTVSMVNQNVMAVICIIITLKRASFGGSIHR